MIKKVFSLSLALILCIINIFTLTFCSNASETTNEESLYLAREISTGNVSNQESKYEDDNNDRLSKFDNDLLELLGDMKDSDTVKVIFWLKENSDDDIYSSLSERYGYEVNPSNEDEFLLYYAEQKKSNDDTDEIEETKTDEKLVKKYYVVAFLNHEVFAPDTLQRINEGKYQREVRDNNFEDNDYSVYPEYTLKDLNLTKEDLTDEVIERLRIELNIPSYIESAMFKNFLVASEIRGDTLRQFVIDESERERFWYECHARSQVYNENMISFYKNYLCSPHSACELAQIAFVAACDEYFLDYLRDLENQNIISISHLSIKPDESEYERMSSKETIYICYNDGEEIRRNLDAEIREERQERYGIDSHIDIYNIED